MATTVQGEPRLQVQVTRATPTEGRQSVVTRRRRAAPPVRERAARTPLGVVPDGLRTVGAVLLTVTAHMPLGGVMRRGNRR